MTEVVDSLTNEKLESLQEDLYCINCELSSYDDITSLLKKLAELFNKPPLCDLLKNPRGDLFINLRASYFDLKRNYQKL
jgi:hypothetical protein